MRKACRTKLNELWRAGAVRGRVLEVGALKADQSLQALFSGKGRALDYTNLDITAGDVPNTVIGDLCGQTNLPAGSFDFVVCSDVFEHLKQPWLAANNIASLLAPGGTVLVFTVWSWRYHPLPVDYWRFSPDCLKFLFADFEVVEADFDISERRKDIRGFWENGLDHVPIDELGGWRENWSSYFIGRKPAG